jgi:hypothetical protein
MMPTKLSQQCFIDEYELLRRQSLDCAQRSTQRVTLALQAVMDGGMVGFMRCCHALLRTSPAMSKTVKPMRQVVETKVTLPSTELTHTLAEMVLTIMSQELNQ